MAKVTIQDFYWRGKHYNSKSFDLDVHNRNDVEISIAFAKKLEECEKLQKEKT